LSQRDTLFRSQSLMPGKWFRQDIKGAIQPPPVWPVSTREFP
jgi:hypothetical protein